MKIKKIVMKYVTTIKSSLDGYVGVVLEVIDLGYLFIETLRKVNSFRISSLLKSVS